MKIKPKKIQIKKVSAGKVLALLSKLRTADSGSSSSGVDFTSEELQLIREIIESWAYLLDEVQAGRLTISEVRELLGFVKKIADGKKNLQGSGNTDANKDETNDSAPPSVNNEGAADPNEASDNKSATNRDNHGRNHAGDIRGLKDEHHGFTGADPIPCPRAECRGILTPIASKRFVIISANPPFEAIQHTIEQRECTVCGMVVDAPVPAELKEDLIEVGGKFRYSISAAVMVTILRYFSGFPWNRQEQFHDMIGSPNIPDASMSDQAERLANALRPISRKLWELAFLARLYLIDDTGARIIREKTIIKPQRQTKKLEERSGCHTTCIIAVLDDAREVILYKTGIHYSGEVMDQLLEGRPENLSKPIVVGDASSQNIVTTRSVVSSGCNAHAVRRFKEVKGDNPVEVGHILALYDKVFSLEEELKKNGITGQERFSQHSEFSKAWLKELAKYAQSLFDDKKVEPNSTLGGHLNYFLNHERELAAFTRHLDVPLDNNQCERLIKLIVLMRKNSYNFRTTVGAAIADVIWACGVTAHQANENIFEYFKAVLKHEELVKKNPEAYLPWNWRATVNDIYRQ